MTAKTRETVFVKQNELTADYVGSVVRIEFLDHAHGSEPLPFVVYGRLSLVEDGHVCVDCWHYASDNTEDENVERFSIVRAAITSIAIWS